MKKLMLAVFAAMSISGCRCGDPSPTYSDGYRVGRLEKFSHKGILFKSWEGYLVLQGYRADSNGNMVRETWNFSVLDADAAKVVPELQKAQVDGKIVKMHYRQDWMGQTVYDSNYFVDEVTEVDKYGE